METAACPCIAQPSPSRGQITFSTAVDSYVPQPVPQTAVVPLLEMVAAIAFEGEPLPGALSDLDRSMDNKLVHLLREAGFTGAFGQRVLLEVQGRYIYLVGVGVSRPAENDRTQSAQAERERLNLCSVFGSFAETALRLGVYRLVVALHGFAEHHVDILGATALLRCRCLMQSHFTGRVLPELVVVVSAADRPLAEAGLKASAPLCHGCTLPHLAGR